MPNLMNHFLVAALCQAPAQNLGSSTEMALVVEEQVGRNLKDDLFQIFLGKILFRQDGSTSRSDRLPVGKGAVCHHPLGVTSEPVPHPPHGPLVQAITHQLF